MLSPDDAGKRLTESGARMTAQRKAVLDVLTGNRTHPTADSIISQVKARLGYISPATIYNTLDALDKLGLVRRIDGLENRTHYDPDTSDHQHAICRTCRRVWDIEPVQTPYGLPEGFQLQDVHILGVCSECASG